MAEATRPMITTGNSILLKLKISARSEKTASPDKTNIEFMFYSQFPVPARGPDSAYPVSLSHGFDPVTAGPDTLRRCPAGYQRRPPKYAGADRGIHRSG